MSDLNKRSVEATLRGLVGQITGRRSTIRRQKLDESAVRAAYSRWAPIYDIVFGRRILFGRIFEIGRKLAVDQINSGTGRVLEVGVGTGISLPNYAPHLRVTGIDLSGDMLAVARRRVTDEKLGNVDDLLEMDAAELEFPDASFQAVAVMYVITVVPQPEAVMAELERVTAPGGEAFLVSHFAADSGWRKWGEDLLKRFASKLGWNPDFPVSRILGRPGFEHVETRRFGPFGMFSMVRLRRLG